MLPILMGKRACLAVVGNAELLTSGNVTAYSEIRRAGGPVAELSSGVTETPPEEGNRRPDEAGTGNNKREAKDIHRPERTPVGNGEAMTSGVRIRPRIRRAPIKAQFRQRRPEPQPARAGNYPRKRIPSRGGGPEERGSHSLNSG
jgi:hypothetical protein